MPRAGPSDSYYTSGDYLRGALDPCVSSYTACDRDGHEAECPQCGALVDAAELEVEQDDGPRCESCHYDAERPPAQRHWRGYL